METIVKLETPETDLLVVNSNLPNQTVPADQDGDVLAGQQEGSATVNVNGTDTPSEYLSDIYKAMDEDEDISAFRVENPNIYNAVRKMLTIAVTELTSEDGDDTEDNDDASEVIVDDAGDAQAAPEALTDITPAVETQGNTMTPVVKVRPDEKVAVAAAPPEAQKIDRYAVPPRAVSNSAKPVGSDDAFTASEIHNFYKDVVRGRYKGREKEADALESRIFRAVKEGRVTA
ncbi:hypothetical protein [Candidatus Magnetominusculus dajiuhuensis]|uniref:hypothetical protein n=1 Tax=Candidatus Magnetominusculus dajiuhuensis TaxID=3137712 RepID=UPI003B4392EA